jgi:hypothetical protein
MVIATTHGVVEGLPENEYHSHPALSSTEARILLRKGGPARYRWAKDNPPMVEPSTKFDIGSAVHTKVLGTGYDIVLVAGDDWRSKAAREAKEEARAQGKIALLQKELEPIDRMAEAVLAHRGARLVFQQPGAREVSVFGVDPETNVPLRARFDFLPDLELPNPVAVDLKTTASEATPEDFGNAAARYGYDTQQEHYRHTLNHAGVAGNMPQFCFVVVEKDPPHLVAVLQLPTVLVDRGRRNAARARRRFAEATKTGVWAGHPEEVQFADVPHWVEYEEDDDE